MSAFELPLTDLDLDSIARARTVRKGRFREEGVQDGAPLITMADSEAAPPGGPSSKSRPIVVPTDPLTSDDVMSTVPSSILRLLSLLAPFIHLLHSFIQLVTWTTGPKSSGSSVMLLVAWWTICTYGYFIIRYAPHLLPLSVIAWNYMSNVIFSNSAAAQAQLQKRQASRARASSSATITQGDYDGDGDDPAYSTLSPTTTPASLNRTLRELEEIADYLSVVRSKIALPILALLTWADEERTKATAKALLRTWPLYLVCALPWPELGLPSLQVHVLVGRVVAAAVSTSRTLLSAAAAKLRILLAERAPQAFEYVTLVDTHTQRFSTAVSPTFHRAIGFVGLGGGSPLLLGRKISIQLIPPFPLFSLTPSTTLFIVGALAFTWSSPWASLVRHAIWRSALIRRVSRVLFALVTGQDPDPRYGGWDLFPQPVSYTSNTTKDGSGDDDLLRASEAIRGRGGRKASSDGAKGSTDSAPSIIRHEDVTYQFSIWENQRWWVGLDWTAALLPNERPSWGDEANNPVSPPSSFSLPAPKTTITPGAVDESGKQTYTRRLVKWQWIDPEWTVAGVAGLADESAVADEPASASASASPAPRGWGGSIAGRFRGTGSRAASVSGSTAGAPPPSTPRRGSGLGRSVSLSNHSDAVSLMGGSGGARRPSESLEDAAADEDPSLLDVDAEGWMYGDNSWNGMSKRAGLGRYTRRRRWARRAVLVEIVERDVIIDPKELGGGQQAEVKAGVGGAASPAPAAVEGIIAAPTSPTPGKGDLKSRLAKVASTNSGGGGGGGGASTEKE